MCILKISQGFPSIGLIQDAVSVIAGVTVDLDHSGGVICVIWHYMLMIG